MASNNIFFNSRSSTTKISIGMLPTSPMGQIWVAITDLGLLAVDWHMPQAEFASRLQNRFHADIIFDGARTAEALSQISEYLAGDRYEFNLTLDVSGLSFFQLQALQFTADIPYAQTRTYQEIAVRMGRPHAARAVGRAEATNPIPLVIPCHRVIGSDGKLHGYGGPGGIKLKAWLLDLELTNLKKTAS